MSINEVPLPDGLDMCIPRLAVLTSFVDKSYTNVKLAPGLKDLVKFEPWPEFDSIVQETKKEIDTFPRFVNSKIKDALDDIREELDPYTFQSETHLLEMSRFNERQKRRSSSSSLRNRVISAASGVTGAPQTGSTEQLHVLESAEIEVDSPTGRQLRNSFGQKTPVISLPEAEKTGISSYSNSNSCSLIHGAVFRVIGKLVRACQGDPRFFIVSELQLNSEVARKYDQLSSMLLEGPDDFCTLVPDQALTTTSSRPANELPICSFEIKGPLREFWKVETPRTVRSSKKKRRLTAPVGGDVASGENEVFGNQRLEDNQVSEVPKISRASRTEKPHNYSAESLAKFYQELFDEQSLMDRGGSKSNYYYVYLPVAQALSQALLSDSGCCALYNHQEMIAFQIWKTEEECSDKGGKERDKKSNKNAPAPKAGDEKKKTNTSLVVRVSRAFSCDEQPGNLCALVALANYSCDQVYGDEKRKIEVRGFFQMVTKSYYNWKVSGGNSNKDGKPGSASKKEGKKGDANSQGKQATPSTAQFSSFPTVNDARTIVNASSVTLSNFSSSSTSAAAAIDSLSECSNESVDISMEDDQVSITKTLASVIRRNLGVIGYGGTSVVIGGIYEGCAVAIKSWNGVSRDGMISMLNEVRVYRELSKKNSEVLGQGVPRLRMSRVLPSEEVLLVTDLVGERIRRQSDRTLVSGGEGNEKRLGTEDIRCICRAAIESLRQLHLAGVLHGDIALRNLRVKKKLWETTRLIGRLGGSTLVSLL